jgi:hypothetical protein
LLAAIDKLLANGLIRTATPWGRGRPDDIDDYAHSNRELTACLMESHRCVFSSS